MATKKKAKKDFRKPLLKKKVSQVDAMTAAAMGAEEEVEELNRKVRKLQKQNLDAQKEIDRLQSQLDAKQSSDDAFNDVEQAEQISTEVNTKEESTTDVNPQGEN